jgi:hypothetical protein
MDAAEEEGAQARSSAELEEGAGMRNFFDGNLGLFEMGMEPFFQLRHGDLGKVAFVKASERKAEFGSKLFESQFGDPGLAKDKVSRPPDDRQVIDQRARPVEDDVPNHVWSLRVTIADAQLPDICDQGTPVRRQSTDSSRITVREAEAIFWATSSVDC